MPKGPPKKEYDVVYDNTEAEFLSPQLEKGLVHSIGQLIACIYLILIAIQSTIQLRCLISLRPACWEG